MPVRKRKVCPDWPEIKSQKQLQFLAAFWLSGKTITATCREVGITYPTVQRWLKGATYKGHKIPPSPAFIAAFEQAKERLADLLENAALEMALGYEEPVFFQGIQTATKTVRSEKLLVKMLDKWKPEYREVKADVNVNVTFDIAERLRQGRLRAAGQGVIPSTTERVIEAKVERTEESDT